LTSPVRSQGLRRRPQRISTRTRGVIAVCVAAVLVLGTGWLIWDNNRLVTTEYEVDSPRLPSAFDGLRIAQLSDVHSRDFGHGNRRLVAAVKAADPDLIAITGDLITDDEDQQVVLDLAAHLQKIAPVYYVTGNHEGRSPRRDGLEDGLRERGVDVLDGRTDTVRRDGQELVVAGVDDPRVDRSGPGGGRGSRTDAQQATLMRDRLAGLGYPSVDAPFTVLLSHRPELLDEYARAGVDVALTGHAHGGQVRIPGIGGLYAPNQGMFPKLTAGVHREGNTQMVISRGLGNSSPVPRVNDPTELVVVTLRR
jgi:predicted MPP superfamily phosphohydrolase